MTERVLHVKLVLSEACKIPDAAVTGAIVHIGRLEQSDLIDQVQIWEEE